MKPQPAEEFLKRGVVGVTPQWPHQDGVRWFMADGLSELVKCPRGRPGDRLWCKETFAPCLEKENHAHAKAGFTYRADWNTEDDIGVRDFRWKSFIFMPRRASRITLEITGVRVERLQDISDGDVAAEGCDWNEPFGTAHGEGRSPAQRAYCRLWESINGKDSWAKNPWVWVIEFKRL